MNRQASRRLTLVRHAKSDWTDPGLDDFDRPLNPRGERDAPEMAARIADEGLAPTLMISSPAARALATARVFARTLDYAEQRIVLADNAYHADPATLLRVVREAGGRAAHVMLFGHHPGLAAFAAGLTTDGTRLAMPTCAVLSMQVDLRDWTALHFGSAKRDFYDFPKSRSRNRRR